MPEDVEDIAFQDLNAHRFFCPSCFCEESAILSPNTQCALCQVLSRLGSKSKRSDCSSVELRSSPPPLVISIYRNGLATAACLGHRCLTLWRFSLEMPLRKATPVWPVPGTLALLCHHYCLCGLRISQCVIAERPFSKSEQKPKWCCLWNKAKIPQSETDSLLDWPNWKRGHWQVAQACYVPPWAAWVTSSPRTCFLISTCMSFLFPGSQNGS